MSPSQPESTTNLPISTPPPQLFPPPHTPLPRNPPSSQPAPLPRPHPRNLYNPRSPPPTTPPRPRNPPVLATFATHAAPPTLLSTPQLHPRGGTRGLFPPNTLDSPYLVLATHATPTTPPAPTPRPHGPPAQTHNHIAPPPNLHPPTDPHQRQTSAPSHNQTHNPKPHASPPPRRN